jgi:acetoin utilization deacetylase AcuC-like enzyme
MTHAAGDFGDLGTPVVWSRDTLLHQPTAEIWLGVRTPGTEVADRVGAIRSAVEAAGAPLVEAAKHDDRILERVHSPALLNHLRTIWADWTAAGLPQDPGQDRVVPYVFPTAAMTAGLPVRNPAAVHARAGRFCYDTMTLVGPGTWEAARSAVDVALTAAGLVGGGHRVDGGHRVGSGGGHRVAYALCRPPGHHACHDGFGGSCYLNNAAVAAEALRAAGQERVAIVDIDAHHGNGTQSLFYHRGDVWYGSVHVDPGAGWFPHYLGFADEVGHGDGGGANLNQPLEPGTGDEAWLAAVRRLRDAAGDFGATALVVSLGVDAALDDPESPLEVTVDGYHAAGAALAALDIPTVALQEGGYHLASLGRLVVASLIGLSG